MNINIGDIDVEIYRKAAIQREGNLLVIERQNKRGNSDGNKGKANQIIPISAKLMDTS